MTNDGHGAPVPDEGCATIRRDARGSPLAASLVALLGFGSGTGHVRNGRIAFEHIGEAGGSQIYSMTYRRTKRRLLTPGEGSSSLSPAYASGGRRIVHVRAYRQKGLWTMHADGSDRRQITNTPDRDEHDPVWSPDGRWLAYVGESSSHGASSYQIYVSRPNGSSRRRITHSCGKYAIINDEPSWQPLR